MLRLSLGSGVREFKLGTMEVRDEIEIGRTSGNTVVKALHGEEEVKVPIEAIFATGNERIVLEGKIDEDVFKVPSRRDLLAGEPIWSSRPSALLRCCALLAKIGCLDLVCESRLS